MNHKKDHGHQAVSSIWVIVQSKPKQKHTLEFY